MLVHASFKLGSADSVFKLVLMVGMDCGAFFD